MNPERSRGGCPHPKSSLRKGTPEYAEQHRSTSRTLDQPSNHRKVAIFGWLAFVVLAFVIGGNVGTKTLDQAESGVGESGHADRVVYHSFPQHSEEGVLIQSKTERADSPQFKASSSDTIEPPQRDRRAPEGHQPLLQWRRRTCRPTAAR